MGESNQGPFREKSLERLSSPERLDQLLSLVDRRSWLPLMVAGVLIALALVWAVVGTIPVHVEGKGILVRPREVMELQSPGSGYLTELRVRVGDTVAAGDVVGVIDRPDLDKQLELQQAKASELGREDTGSSRRLARTLRDKALQSIREERERLEEQSRLERGLADSLRQRLENQNELKASGIISTEATIEAEESYNESLSRLSDIEARLRALRPRELEIEQRHMDRLEEISDREQDLADVEREIARLQHLLLKESKIVSEHRGRVLEINVGVGEFLAPGARIGSIATNGSSEFVSLTYFTVPDGKRLEEGMPIRVTPDTVERERFGSIRGTITSISAFPVTLAEAEKVIGNREVAETLIAGGYRIQVFASLERDPMTPSAFRWSSSRGPEMTLSAGTTTTARVAVEERPPISFILPLLRSSTGID